MVARWWLPLFWLMVAIGAAGALVLEWRHPPQLSVAEGVNIADPVAVPPLQPFQPLPVSRYMEIAERPIFIEGRRPEEEEPAAPPVAPPTPDRPLQLIGVVRVSHAATALLRPEEPNAKVLRVPQGGMVDGWQLETVRADAVVLRKGNEVRELGLIRPPASPRPIPPGKTVPRSAPVPRS